MKNAFQAFAINTSDNKINKFVYKQWVKSGYKNGFKNYLLAEEECYKVFENHIKAAFDFEQRPLNNNPAISYFLTTRTPGPNQRTKNNGLAHLKIVYRHIDKDGFYNEDNYYIRALFPKKGRISFSNSPYFKNLTHFIAFIDETTFAIIDNAYYYKIMKLCDLDRYNRRSILISELIKQNYAAMFNIDGTHVTNLVTGKSTSHIKYGNILSKDSYLQCDGKQSASYLVMNEYSAEAKYLPIDDIANLFGKNNKTSFKQHIYRYLTEVKKSVTENIQIKPFSPRGIKDRWYILPLEYFKNFQDLASYNKNAKSRTLTNEERLQKEFEHANIMKYRAWLKRHEGHMNPKWNMDDIAFIMNNKSLVSLVTDELYLENFN